MKAVYCAALLLAAAGARADGDDDGPGPRPLPPHASGPGFTFLSPLVTDATPQGAFDAAERPVITISQIDVASLAPLAVVQSLTTDATRREDRIRAGDDAYRGTWDLDEARPAPGTLWRLSLSLAGRTLGWIDVLVAGRHPPAPPPGETWVMLPREKAHGDYPIRFFLNGCAPVVCTALDSCHVAGACDPATLQCSNPTADDGTACEDGNLCTAGDTCSAGVCTPGAAVTCQVPDACHAAGSCDPATGACVNPPPANDGTPCTGADLCQSGATCEAGACVGTAKSCPTDVCAAAPASCQPSTGSCVDAADACLTVTQTISDEAEVAIWDYYGTISAWWWNYHAYGAWDPALGTLRKVTVDQTLTMAMGDGPGDDTCSERMTFSGGGLWTGDSWTCSPNTTYEKQYSFTLDQAPDWTNTGWGYYIEGRAITTPFHFKNVTTLTYHYFPK